MWRDFEGGVYWDKLADFEVQRDFKEIRSTYVGDTITYMYIHYLHSLDSNTDQERIETEFVHMEIV